MAKVMIKYSFLMPYYKRAGQLHNTLTSFLYHYSDRDDYEVIIVADGKNHTTAILNEQLNKVVDFFKADIKIILNNYEEAVINPSVLFNRAAKLASGDIFIVTNPECFHMSNILAGLDNEFNNGRFIYVVCACESSKENNLWIEKFSDFQYVHHIWYQHSLHRNALFHFCNVLRRGDYFLIGGFDERFAKGLCFDDDDFREKVKDSGMKIIIRDDLLTIHQRHKKEHLKMKNYRQLWLRNKQLYERIHKVAYHEI